MSEDRKDEAPVNEAERSYEFLCLGALILVFVGLVLRGLPPLFSLAIILIGVVGIQLRSRAIPVLQLVAVLVGWSLPVLLELLNLEAVGHLAGRFRPEAESQVADLFLCIGMLGFVISHLRLHGLTVAIFPRDWRRRELLPPGTRNRRERFSPPRGPVLARRRGKHLATTQELGILLVSLPLWAGLAHVLYLQTAPRKEPEVFSLPTGNLEPNSQGERIVKATEQALNKTWASRFLIWGLGGGVLLVSVLLRHLALRSMTPAEATLLLQDTLWAETRREQRRINRWLAWARLRQSRKEDKP